MTRHLTAYLTRAATALIVLAAVMLCSLTSRGEEPQVPLAETIEMPAAHIDSVHAAAMTKALQEADSVKRYREEHDWWHLLRQNRLNLKDSTVIYPGFIGFCVKVYNWGDKFFNGVDPNYIRGTGRRWKASVKSDNWVDSYAMNFFSRMPIRMMSDIYCNAGAYLQYMAVSVGYSLDLSNIIGNKPMNHNKMEFSFTCQRLEVDAYLAENTGGSYLRRFGDYKRGHLIKEEFPGLKLHSLGLDVYYFLNHKKYSQGAAYSFSRIQLKSAGSIIAGFNYSNLNIDLDFNTLPEKLRPFLTIAATKYRFNYDTYNLMVGYGYNCVFAKNWLFNITALPAVGINHCREDATEASATLLSLCIKGRFSFVYNYKDIFLGVNGKFDGHWYKSHDYSFFSSIENLAAVIGVRF